MTTTESGFVEVISTHQGHISDEHMLKKDSEKISGKKIVADSKYGTLENRKYCKKINKILVAPTRKNMKHHLKEKIMDDAFLYNKTEQYKEEMKKRGSNVEGKFGYAKTKLGGMPALRRAHENPGGDQSSRGHPEDTRVPRHSIQTPADRLSAAGLLFFLN